MRTTTVEVGVPVAVRTWGDGARSLLYLHSMGPVSTGALAGAAVRPLVDAGYTVQAPDLPGYGETPPLPPDDYELGRLAAWMWSVADELGMGSTTLVGHSWGGSLACHLAATRPDRVTALVLADSGHLDYADTLGDDLALTLDEWIERARSRRLHAADAAALAADFELEADDPLVELLLVGTTAVADGLVPRVRPEGQGAAL